MQQPDHQYACKSIIKQRAVAGRPLSEEAARRVDRDRLDKIKREIEVMERMRGCLNVCELIEVLEDEEHVHLIMELCKGGELSDRITLRHYSEKTVASYLRAVLRTLAIMHSRSILHNDVKPGNFMLLNDSETSPLKSIDFGLATPFSALPVTTSGLEGTPWYQSPELLETSTATPAADVWAVGIMAHQLLVGSFPFDDKKNRRDPSLAAIWRSILSDPLDLSGKSWNDISKEGKEFVSYLLQKDPLKRPTAKEALDHPFLQGVVEDRVNGASLNISVVAGIQRFAMSSAVKRSVLQSMASELLEVGKVGESARRLVKAMSFDGEGRIDSRKLEKKLEAMGYHMEQGETERLVDSVGSDGKIDSSVLAASLIDWRDLQKNHPEEWKRLVLSAFTRMDESRTGSINASDVAHLLGAKLGEEEVQEELALALHEAALRGAPSSDDMGDMSEADFSNMLMVDSLSSLDLYESRWSGQNEPDEITAKREG